MKFKSFIIAILLLFMAFKMLNKNMSNEEDHSCLQLFEGISLCIDKPYILKSVETDTVVSDNTSSNSISNKLVLANDTDSGSVEISFNLSYVNKCSEFDCIDESDRQEQRLKTLNRNAKVKKKIVTLDNIQFSFVHESISNFTRLSGCLGNKIVYIDINSYSITFNHEEVMNGISFCF